MALKSSNLVDWIVDREALLAAAWTPQIEAALVWDQAFAAAFAGELNLAMVTTLMRGGSESDFFGIVARSNTGLNTKVERMISEKFYNVTLKLARAACRSAREDSTRCTFPVKRAFVVGDSETDPAHLALHGVTLPYDHPFWQRWHPPLGMDCRCGVRPMTRGEVGRSQQGMTKETELADRESRLCDGWPTQFLPLLDFRLPPAPFEQTCRDRLQV